MTEHWLILGGSSAMARAFAREAAREHAAVTLVGRDVDDLQASASDALLRGAVSARVIVCDITDAASRQACAAAALLPDTRLNVFLAVGLMPEQDTMDTDAALAAAMIDATYTGPLAMLQLLAPLFEQQRGGRVVVVGSVAGDRGRRKNYLYGSAKAGLATYAEGLRARLFSSGVSVTLVKPGFVDTAMTWGLPGLFLVASPQAAAAAMLRAAHAGRANVYVPGFWRWIMLIIKLIPPGVMKRLSF